MVVLPVLLSILATIAIVIYYCIFGVTRPIVFFAEALGLLLLFVLTLAAGLKWIRERL